MAAIELFSTSLYSDASLRNYYRLENTTDTKSAVNLTNNGSATFTAGQFNNAVNLGTTDADKCLYTTSNPLSSANTANLTINFWVKILTEIGSGFYRFFELNSGAGTGNGALLQYDYNSGTRRLHANTSLSIANADVFYTVKMGTSNWFMLTYVKSSTTGLELYVNGASVGTNTGSGTDVDNNATNKFVMGASRTLTGSNALCLIDDFSTFERVLTPTEISQIYTGDFGGGGFYHMSV